VVSDGSKRAAYVAQVRAIEDRVTDRSKRGRRHRPRLSGRLKCGNGLRGHG
jgi:hypothetical protein